jgi:hypothetical protein
MEKRHAALDATLHLDDGEVSHHPQRKTLKLLLIIILVFAMFGRSGFRYVRRIKPETDIRQPVDATIYEYYIGQVLHFDGTVISCQRAFDDFDLWNVRINAGEIDVIAYTTTEISPHQRVTLRGLCIGLRTGSGQRSAVVLDEAEVEFELPGVYVAINAFAQKGFYVTENASLSLLAGNEYVIRGPAEISYSPFGNYIIKDDVLTLFQAGEETFTFLIDGDTLIFERGAWLENWIEPGSVFVLSGNE